MEAFFVSAGATFLAEMGDKTQLLAFVLAAKFKRPVPIILGMLTATLANHALAGAVGVWVANQLGPLLLRWVIGLGFLGMAVWVLIPDKLDDEDENQAPRWGVYVTTVVAYFLAEMGDKTQLATVGLAAHYHDLLTVVAGTTCGMMLADVPAVFLGERFAKSVSMRWVHGVAAALFAVLGLAAIMDWGSLF